METFLVWVWEEEGRRKDPDIVAVGGASKDR